MMEAALTDEVRARFEAIEAELDPQIDNAAEAAKALEKMVKAEVLEVGTTIQGDGLMAVWNKGRTSGHSSQLEGYARANTEILAMRKIGKPSVSIRTVKKAETL